MRIILLIGLIGLLSTGCAKSDTGVVLQSISFDDDEITLAPGNQIKLIPTFKPTTFSGIPVVWTSSDPTIITVIPDGTITALNRGKAWITIQDKNSATSGKCQVTVQ